MEVMHARCAGLDVHKKVIVAAIRVFDGSRQRETVREFGSTTNELIRLADWLDDERVTHVAMEATGVYWRPVWHILCDRFELILANPATIRNVPGRKTDVKDAQWIAKLLAHGLIEASLVPPPVIQEARDLLRTRKQLRHEITAHTLRIQKLLEDANIKLSSVLTDILGASGRNMLQAIIQGVTDPDALAALAVGRANKKAAELREALFGRITSHHRFMLSQHLTLITGLERSIAEIDNRLEDVLRPFHDTVERLSTIPGVSTLVARTILAEIGVDMTRFHSVAHLRSWACLCPRNDQSAGKRRSTAVRKGSNWLKTALVQAAWAGARTKGSYTKAQFCRLRARRGAKKAAIAVASSLLTAAYFIIRDQVTYHELGADYFDRCNKTAVIQRHIKRLQELGCTVQVTPAA
jgi:transposase